MPRPSKEPAQRRTGWLAFRASPHELTRIHSQAAMLDLSPSAYARQRSLGDIVMPRRRAVDPQAVAALVGLCNNVNQIAKHANAGRGLPHDAVIQDIFSQIYIALDRLHDPFDQHRGPDL